MKIELGFGKGVQAVEIPEENLRGILTPNDVPHGLMGEEEVRRALSAPIGTPPLREIVKPGEKIAIITSDITRPMPTYTVCLLYTSRTGLPLPAGSGPESGELRSSPGEIKGGKHNAL